MSICTRKREHTRDAQSALALPLGELSRVSVTERVIEYLHRKYSIIPDFRRKSGALSDLAALGHLSHRERQVTFWQTERPERSVPGVVLI